MQFEKSCEYPLPIGAAITLPLAPCPHPFNRGLIFGGLKRRVNGHAAVGATANGSQHSDQPPDRLLAIPSDSDQFGRVGQWHRLALGDRRPDLDATALHLRGKTFCGLLALDDEGSVIPRMKSGPPATGSPRPHPESLAKQGDKFGTRPRKHKPLPATGRF
jgi:hypothetical protein